MKSVCHKDLLLFLVLAWIALVIPFDGFADAVDGLGDGKAAGAGSEQVSRGAADPGAANPAEEMTDLVDIRPPVTFGWDPRWKFLAAALAVLALAALLLLLWRRRRRRDLRPAGPPPEPEDRVALRDLGSLSADRSCPDREFYFRLSGILRAYLDRRYELDTLERTADELIPLLKQLETERPDRAALQELFRFSDPVKFAGRTAGGQRRRDDLVFARAFVEKTRQAGGTGV